MLDNLSTKQKKFVVIIAVIIVTCVLYYIYKETDNKAKYVNESMLIQNNSENTMKEATETKKTIIIHIAGAVKKPGIVKLEEGSRIEDAINKAGGLTEDADITNVNLAYVIEDGTKINIPRTSLEVDTVDEEQEIIQDGSGENVIEDKIENANSVRTGKY